MRNGLKPFPAFLFILLRRCATLPPEEDIRKIEKPLTLLFLLFWLKRREGKTAKAARVKGLQGFVMMKETYDEICRD